MPKLTLEKLGTKFVLFHWVQFLLTGAHLISAHLLLLSALICDALGTAFLFNGVLNFGQNILKNEFLQFLNIFRTET